MKIASFNDNSPDGKLMIVSHDLKYGVDVGHIAPNLQTAMERWSTVAPELEDFYTALNNGELDNASLLDISKLVAPLPRAWQWLDGSCFLNHGHLMQKAYHLDPIDDADKFPLVYQGAGDNFTGPTAPIIIPEPSFGTDFEGEFGVIIDDVPMGITAEKAMEAIRLVVMLNDISYRALAPREMKTGFGFVQSKGATAFAPIAVTPDELGDAWQNGKLHLTLQVQRNGKWFGSPNGRDMHFGFDDVIAYAARTRQLNAGTVIGSGTVSNANPEVGQACISELRAKEHISFGQPQTPFLARGETVEMSALDAQGVSVFGEIKQRVEKVDSHV